MANRTLREDLRDWYASLRFSGYTVLIIAMVIIGGVTVSPTLSTYVQQQRVLAELRESVRLKHEEVAAIETERNKWQDPSYVRAQARGRLFYVMPGEIQLSVIDDVLIPAERNEETVTELTPVAHNWASTLAISTVLAGVTDATPAENEGQ